MNSYNIFGGIKASSFLLLLLVVAVVETFFRGKLSLSIFLPLTPFFLTMGFRVSIIRFLCFIILLVLLGKTENTGGEYIIML